MSMFEQMRDNLLTSIEKNHSGTLRAITDAENDILARFAKVRKDAEAEYSALLQSVYDTYGKPDSDTQKANVPEVSGTTETIIT